jgi:hypothetical protein
LEVAVAFKVNYGLERAERNRAKQAKKDAKAKAKKSLADSDVETGVAAPPGLDQPAVEDNIAGEPIEVSKKDD